MKTIDAERFLARGRILYLPTRVMSTKFLLRLSFICPSHKDYFIFLEDCPRAAVGFEMLDG
jgi:hypothetical protein